ncbi:MAG: deoxyhypusine synthase [Gemmatimonas sp. SM23_52]|nr:MAG: deoxyhypusine synthase [Gemmatimonas sp. SM23_52]
MPKQPEPGRSSYLSGPLIDPQPLDGSEGVADLIDRAFLAYNAGRLREACRLFVEKLLGPQVTIGLGLSGALTPAGLGMSALIPLVEAGFVDWIVATGAILYHDTHFGIGLELRRGRPNVSDVELREEGVVRIYDIFFDYQVLLSTDAFFRQIIEGQEFQRTMGTAEFHHLCGRYVAERERALGLERKSLLAVCHAMGVPVYTSSPGDSSIGMNVAERALAGGRLRIDSAIDVNETAALVLAAKRSGGKSAVVIMGGGSPKNFILQTEPQIQEVLGLEEAGHDYFIQITDARPDTGGLSGATPSEAVSWGKVDPNALPDTVVCYLDVSVGLPLFAAYALARHERRTPKRLYDRRGELLAQLEREYREARG